MNAQHVVKGYDFTVDAPRSQVFPLLCPVRERDWIEDWACELLHSRSGFAEQGCVFSTNLPGRGMGTWVMTRRDALAGEVEFVVHYPQRFVEVLAIHLTSPEPRSTKLSWRRTYTALSSEGAHYLEHELDPLIGSWVKHTEASLKHFLRTGEKLLGGA